MRKTGVSEGGTCRSWIGSGQTSRGVWTQICSHWEVLQGDDHVLVRTLVQRLVFLHSSVGGTQTRFKFLSVPKQF